MNFYFLELLKSKEDTVILSEKVVDAREKTFKLLLFIGRYCVYLSSY